MICVIATIEVAAGRRDELLAAVRKIVPTVLSEPGCIEYGPMVDALTSVPGQAAVRPSVVTMIEKWESLAALEAHLKTPHMMAFFERTGDMRRGLGLRILQPA
jgi:quinol monooxygenase YgiN